MAMKVMLFEEENYKDRNVRATISFNQVDYLINKEICFCLVSSWLFVIRFYINKKFLNTDLDVCCKNKHYLKARQIVNDFKITQLKGNKINPRFQFFNNS